MQMTKFAIPAPYFFYSDNFNEHSFFIETSKLGVTDYDKSLLNKFSQSDNNRAVIEQMTVPKKIRSSGRGENDRLYYRKPDDSKKYLKKYKIIWFNVS